MGLRTWVRTTVDGLVPERVLGRHTRAVDQWSHSARELFRVALLAAMGVVACGLALVLLLGPEWRGVLAGALLAWGVSLPAWAIGRFRATEASIVRQLRYDAEQDFLHHRLNQIAAQVGAPTVAVIDEFPAAVGVRMQHLAHMNGVEEIPLPIITDPDGWKFWAD